MSIKIMIADDHVLCREGIKKLLECDNTIEVISEVSNGEECLLELSKLSPDILLLDIAMPKVDGMEVLKEIKKKRYPVKVLIVTAHNEIEYLIKAYDLGTDGYIVKDSDSKELKRAIINLIDGKTYIQPNLLPLLNNRLLIRNLEKDKLDTLTKREKEMLVYIAKGMFNKEIAMELKISERTVKNHISNLFKKIDVNDRTQAAVFAIKNDLVKLY